MEVEDAPGVTLLARQGVYENSRFHVHADRIRDGLGREVADFLVVAPKARGREGVSGCVVLPVVAGRFVLLRIFRHPVSRWIWEAPGGFCDPGESSLETARRELQEETGLVCPPGRIWDLGCFNPAPGLLNARVALAVAMDCLPGSGQVEGELGLLPGWREFTPAEVFSLEARGELQDAATLLAFYRCMVRFPEQFGSFTSPDVCGE
ncbi:MAG: NUDIX hydrolase [Magnetococcales bacterium]|nr:NUDIX hydrolase [Magnetococcales bacterium]MBF0321406.1 NUDIX hydrolase [Magnetococcales bacterium]